jgi:hypothetical protein
MATLPLHWTKALASAAGDAKQVWESVVGGLKNFSRFPCADGCVGVNLRIEPWTFWRARR